MKRFFAEEDGQDMVEYSLLLAFIALSGAAAILSIGGNINILWSAIDNRLSSADQGP